MNTTPTYLKNPSRSNPGRSASWTEQSYKEKDTESPRSGSYAEHTADKDEPDVEAHSQGWICGGQYLEEVRQNEELHLDGPLTELDIDLPLTRTQIVNQGDKQLVELKFAPDDPSNPFKWGNWKRRLMSTQLNLMTLFIGLATTSYSATLNSMALEFDISTEIGELGLFTFNLTCAIAPLFLAPFCELVGRKIIYAGAYLCFCLCFIGLALGKNIETILVMRTLLGLFGCVGTILVGGTFSDMYDTSERAGPMAMFSYVAILGTVGAPIYAGFIDMTIGWRWVEGIQGLSNIPLLICIFLFFKETRGGVGLQKRAKAVRKATGDDRYQSAMDFATPSVKAMLKASSVKALYMLATEPVVFLFGIWIGFSWFIVFLFLSAIPITFQEKRGWNEGVGGLPYISLCIGVTLGWLAHHIQMRRYARLTRDPNHKIVPEDRLWAALWGAVWMPIGLFIYSFTQYGYLSWVGPTVALAPIAFGVYFIFESTYSYTADCYGESSSSAIAGQGLIRNSLGAVSPLFASQFFHNVGSQYAGLILSLIASVLTLVPYIFYKYGHLVRSRSKLAIIY
jgi:MFS family permease